MSMASTLDDDDLSLSIPSNSNRRNSNRVVNQNGRTPGNHRAYGNGQAPGQPSGLRTDQALQRTTQRLGQYTVVKTLGEGSFGKVKLAVHRVSGQKVALKIISRRKLITRDMAGRIEREIQYLQLLRHPHIIKLYTVITNPTDIIMVLEYAGGELFEFLVQHGRMPEDRARKFFQQIVCAVEYCHRHKIVHRDLKPENLLLDDKLNVKIADFGLSNIMTDGNFLKTSCGSPNYAAPEVISGKLYAGPEVDVWSCGVILYVLLVGRLPFDDEYIPALFKKIAHGNYTIPNYVSAGAVKLIKKILVINPMNRITVAEIRQDPWFNKDLAPYLQLPPEDIFESGADPNKAIDPRSLAASKPPEVAEKLHSSVIGKLGKTMGYGEVDVLEALAKSEPSAIKDAYLIVRENQIMRENPLLAKEAGYEQFLAQSPPAFTPHTPPIASLTSSHPPHFQGTSPSRASVDQFRSGPAAGATDARGPPNTVAVLPSSLPAFHTAYMRGEPPQTPGSPEINASEIDSIPAELPSDEQAANARRLRPYTRSQYTSDMGNSKPEAMTPMPQEKKKVKPTKWQFGIRSKTQPVDAMVAIYGALKDLDAEWEVPKYKKPSREGSPDGSGSDSKHSNGSRNQSNSRSTSSSRSRSRSGSRNARYANGRTQDENGSVEDHPSSSSRGRARRRRKAQNEWKYKIPEDPWVIHARFRKEGMFPPGMLHPGSSHSSRADLQEERLTRRRSSTNPPGPGAAIDTGSGSYAGPPGPSSAHSSGQLIGSEQRMTPIIGPTTSATRHTPPVPDEAAYVYMTIQLYTIDTEFYLVDFKCAGYERLVKEVVREVREHVASGTDASTTVVSTDGGDNGDGVPNERWRVLAEGEIVEDQSRVRVREREVGLGRAESEKLATSPFPFLDVTSKLIVHLARS